MIHIRPVEAGDMAFVLSSWSRGFKDSYSAGMIASEDWAEVMRPQFQKVLARPTTRVFVADELDDPAFLYGYVAGDISERVPVVYFLYVKEAYRRAGYARALLTALGVDPMRTFEYTCWTPVLAELGAKIPHAIHNPTRARYGKPKDRSVEWKR